MCDQFRWTVVIDHYGKVCHSSMCDYPLPSTIGNHHQPFDLYQQQWNADLCCQPFMNDINHIACSNQASSLNIARISVFHFPQLNIHYQSSTNSWSSYSILPLLSTLISNHTMCHRPFFHRLRSCWPWIRITPWRGDLAQRRKHMVFLMLFCLVKWFVIYGLIYKG